MTTVPGPTVSARAERISPVVAGTPVGRRRRPSGEPPPLPRHVDATTRWYLALAGLTVLLWIALTWRPALAAVTRADLTVLRVIGHLHSHALTRVMLDVAAAGGPWVPRVLAWGTIVVLAAWRRLGRLATYLILLLMLAVVDTTVDQLVGRSRPLGVPLLGHWSGYSHPSRPIVQLAFVLIGALYMLVPAGRYRNGGLWVAGVAVALVSFSRLYLGVDHPTDVVAALTTGWGVPIAVFRLLTPDEAFPISYRGRRRAHLDVGGPRRQAILTALDQQLGMDVTDVEPFGLEGSAGSTPLRIRVRGPDGRERTLFAKLYALNHLRADRWYKLARTILYGRLEDEKPSRRSAGSSSTRTTCSGCSATPGCPRRGPTASSRSPRNANTSLSWSSSPTPARSGGPQSTTR